MADDEGQWSRAYLHQHTAAGMEIRWKSKQWKGNRLTLPYAETGLRLCKLPKPQQAFEAAQEIEMLQDKWGDLEEQPVSALLDAEPGAPSDTGECPAWLGSVVHGVWQIRADAVQGALEWVMGGLIASMHVVQVSTAEDSSTDEPRFAPAVLHSAADAFVVETRVAGRKRPRDGDDEPPEPKVVTEYEKERLEKIARNEAFLMSLGFNEVAIPGSDSDDEEMPEVQGTQDKDGTNAIDEQQAEQEEQPLEASVAGQEASEQGAEQMIGNAPTEAAMSEGGEAKQITTVESEVVPLGVGIQEEAPVEEPERQEEPTN